MNITGFHNGQPIVDSIPDGWKIDKPCGSLPGYVYIYDESNNRILAPCPGSKDFFMPVYPEWFMEYVEACHMNPGEFGILNVILAQVEAFDNDTNTWGHYGECCLSVQEFADVWSMSLTTVRSAIKVLELAGIITVEARVSEANRITLTPHTKWVASDFRKLRASVKGK